ncbi:glycolate oxidase [Phlyctema vagabunda]|uniref:D-lactate dehydrogenase (cytochrome) n=1 Tax=Phlyctema vagabunda TaxID=108571 RepID=A0ABR4PK15_9HELO
MAAFARLARRVVAVPAQVRVRPSIPLCKRWNSSSNATRKPLEAESSPTKASSIQYGILALVIGSGFALGFAANEYTSSKDNGTAAKKFAVPKYASVPEMVKALAEIRSTLSEETISTDPEDLKVHGYSEWAPANIDTLPIAVAYPRSTDEVSKIAKICNKYRIPMIGYSGGSSLEGNFAAPHGGISVDFAYMDKVIELHEEDMDVVVQPSVPWMKLNEDITKTGLFFPIDPSPSAQFGGMVGTNCSGTNAVRYGTMKDWVVNLTVVLADGTIIKTRNRPRKSAAGYNLNGIFVGSEGTLGLVTEITLKLAVIPKEFSVAVVTFPTIRDAAATASAVMRSGVPVAALEFLDETQMSVVNRGGFTSPRVWKELPTLFFKFSGSKASVADNIKEVQAISKAHNGGTFEFAKGEKEQNLLWSARKQALWSLLSLRPEGTELWTTDVAVPYSRLADIIEISKKEMQDLGLFSSIVGHLGDGNFHEAIMYHKSDPVETAAVMKISNDMVTRALAMDGTCTGEHAVGIFKKDGLLQELGPETMDVMKSIKQSLDPLWLMNPGKIFDTPT